VTSKFISENVFQNQRSTLMNKPFDVVNLSPKLEYYRRVKNDFNQEDWLNWTVFKYRSALTKLRISAHPLKNEYGRYQNPNTHTPVLRHLRLCRYCTEVCQLKYIKSEEHALYIVHMSTLQ
jgi:hypothetical protein